VICQGEKDRVDNISLATAVLSLNDSENLREFR
jgi:hypothetical protein